MLEIHNIRFSCKISLKYLSIRKVYMIHGSAMNVFTSSVERSKSPSLPLAYIINYLRPSDAYMRRYSNQHWFRKWLVAWTAPSHYLNQCWNIVNWTLRNKCQWNFNQNSSIFIQANAFENVICEMASILSQPQCVKKHGISSSRFIAPYGWRGISHPSPCDIVVWFIYTLGALDM